MSYQTQAEREAFKAGVRKGERNVANASISLQGQALIALWELLGADGQTDAIQKIKSLRDRQDETGDYFEIRRANGELSEKYNNLSDVSVERMNQIERLNEVIRDKNEAITMFAAGVREAIGERDSARKMAEFYKAERDKLDAKIDNARAALHMPMPERSDDMIASIIPEPTKSVAQNTQMVGRGLRPVDLTEKVIIDFIYRHMKEIKAVLGVE